jgi:hypothetical protein
MTTLRHAIRVIVDRAHLAGKPITSRLIWGLLDQDVNEGLFGVELSAMVKRGEVRMVPQPLGPACYEPGDKPTGTKSNGHWRSGLLGFKALCRLNDAREEAREWERAVA